MSSIDKLLEKFPYFLNKSTGSNFYKSEWVFNEWFKEVYNDLFLTYCSQKLSKPLLVWKVQNEPYKYNMCFAVVLNNLKTVIIYQNDVIVYREDYGPEDNQNSFFHVLNGVCEDNIIPDDSFLLYVESYDEYVLCKGFPENDENDYISINETVFEDLSVELKINTSVPDVANVCVMKGSDVVYTNTDNIDETFKINEPTLYDSYYVKVTTSNPLIYYEKRWSKLDSYSHDSSLDELGVFYSMPRKTYTYTHHKKWYNTYYASTEPPYNNRYTEDDYHYMNRIITYTTLYHTTPLPILELWKLFGITATIKNRKDILCKMYEKSLHDPNWKPDDDYSHKNLMYVEPESNVKMLIVTVDNSSPYYGMPVYFNLTLYDEHFNTRELKGYVEVYERTNDNNTLIDTIQVNNWVLDTNNLNNGIHAYTFKYYEDDVFICESDELFITLKGCDDADIYISTDGDDNNDGSKNKPVKSFEKAINLVESNKSLIFVGAGDYYLKNTLNINKSCTITHCQNGEVNIHSPTKVVFNIMPDTVLNLVNVNCWFRDFVYRAVMDTHSNNSKTGIISGVTVTTGNTKKDPGLSCTVDKDTGVVGDTLTFTPHLSDDATGSIVYTVDGAEYTKNVGETFTYKFNKIGSFTVTAVYSGDDSYQGATASVLVTINKINLVFTGSASSTNVYVGETVTISGTLKTSTGSPLRNVKIIDGAGQVQATTGATGAWSFTSVEDTVGTSGWSLHPDLDWNKYNTPENVDIQITTRKRTTVLTCTVDKTSVTVGENVLCTLYLKDNQNNPLANKTVYCGDLSKTTNEEGRVIFNYANPSTGAVTKVFKFDGDTSYKGASVTANWTVNKKPVNITVTVDKTSVTVGETVTLTATVKSDGVNVNEGQVDFGDGVFVDVSNGTAVKTFTKTTPTVLTVTPSYKGTSTYTTATASSLTITWIEEQVTPEISISASALIGEVGDDLPITLSSNLKNTALTVLLNDAEVVDSVTTDNTGNAVFNYNCNGAGDVNVKVKYLNGTNVYYSNILNLEDCLFYDTMTSESDRWVRTSDIIVNIDSEGTKFSTNSNSEQLYKLPSKYFTPPYTIEFDWITGGGNQKMGVQLFPDARYSGASCWYAGHWDSGANKFTITTYPSSTSSSKTETQITRDINPNDHLKYIVEPNNVKLYQNGELILSKHQGKTFDTQYFSFFTNKNRIQKVKNLKIKHYSE